MVVALTELTIISMQILHLLFELEKITVVDDDVMSQGQAFLSACLAGQDTPDQGFIQAVSLSDSFNLQPFGTVDHENPVDHGLRVAFHQQGDGEQTVGCSLSICLATHLCEDSGVENSLESGSGLGVAKHMIPQPGTIEFSLASEESSSEFADHPLQGGLSGSDQCTRNLVGIEHGYSTLLEQPGDCAFAAAYSAGQPYFQH